ncbi:MAG: amidohydrolase family protein, partial [Opitutaceae bacterium]
DMICLCSAGAVVGESNSVVMKAARKYPDVIIPLAYVELGRDEPGCVDRYAAEGFRGFKITNPRSSYDDEAHFPVFERMEKTGLPVLAHTGILMRFPQPAGMRVNSSWMRPICLEPVVRSFPELSVVGAHLGVPWHEEASTMARLHPNYYVDLTGACGGGWRLNKDPEFFRYHFFWEGAWDKVIFGTDMLALDELLPAKRFHDKMIAPLGLSDAILGNIYGGTAARLLGIGSEAHENDERHSRHLRLQPDEV